MAASRLVLPDTSDLEDDSVVQRIVVAVPTWCPVEVASTQLPIDFRGDSSGGAQPVAGGELTPEVLADWLVLSRHLGLRAASIFFESNQVLTGVRYNTADAMVQQPSTSIETMHTRMKTLHQLDWPAALPRSMAIPAAGIHVERGGALIGQKGALGPPVVVFGLLGVFGELEGLEELAPVGILADFGKVFGNQPGRGFHEGR
jgi:hypothetical protein